MQQSLLQLINSFNVNFIHFITNVTNITDIINDDVTNITDIINDDVTVKAVIILFLAVLLILLLYLLVRLYWIHINNFLVLFTKSMSLPTIYMPHKIILILFLFLCLSLTWLLTSEFIYFIRDHITFVSNHFSLIFNIMIATSILTSTYLKFNIITRFYNAFIKGIPFFIGEFSNVRTSERGLLLKQCLIYYVMTILLLIISYNIILRIDNNLLFHDSILGQLSFIYTSLFSSISGILYIYYSYNKPYDYNNKRIPNVSIMLLQFILTMLPVLFIFHYIISFISISVSNNMILQYFYKLFFNIIECQPDTNTNSDNSNNNKIDLVVTGNKQINVALPRNSNIISQTVSDNTQEIINVQAEVSASTSINTIMLKSPNVIINKYFKYLYYNNYYNNPPFFKYKSIKLYFFI